MNNPTRPEKRPDIAEQKTDEASKTLSHNPWSLLEIGATVLYRASKDEGWFEAKIIAVKDEKTFTLKWRDYPGFEPFNVRRTAVGLLCKVS